MLQSEQDMSQAHAIASMRVQRPPDPHSSPDTTLSGLGLQEGQQVGVELILVRAGEAVGRTWIDLESRVLDDLGGEQGRGTDGHNLVVVAVNDQGRNIEPLAIFGAIGLRESLNAVLRAFETNGHRPAPDRIPKTL